MADCCDWWRLVSSVVGVIVGPVMFILFFSVWGNHSAGVWALFSGVFAAVCLHMTVMHVRGSLDAWHSVDTLHGMMLLGVMASLAGGAGLVWYLFVGFYHHIPVLPVGPSAFIAAVWAAMTLKFGVSLTAASRAYIWEMYRENPRLITL